MVDKKMLDSIIDYNILVISSNGFDYQIIMTRKAD